MVEVLLAGVGGYLCGAAHMALAPKHVEWLRGKLEKASGWCLEKKAQMEAKADGDIGCAIHQTVQESAGVAPDPRLLGKQGMANKPCHCGSGRKYKKCHMAADRRAQ